MLTGTGPQATGSMVNGPNFWRTFSVNLIVGPDYTYTVQKVGRSRDLRLLSTLLVGSHANKVLSFKVKRYADFKTGSLLFLTQ